MEGQGLCWTQFHMALDKSQAKAEPISEGEKKGAEIGGRNRKQKENPEVGGVGAAPYQSRHSQRDRACGRPMPVQREST